MWPRHIVILITPWFIFERLYVAQTFNNFYHTSLNIWKAMCQNKKSIKPLKCHCPGSTSPCHPKTWEVYFLFVTTWFFCSPVLPVGTRRCTVSFVVDFFEHGGEEGKVLFLVLAGGVPCSSFRELFQIQPELVDCGAVWKVLVVEMPVGFPRKPTPYLLSKWLLHTPWILI